LSCRLLFSWLGFRPRGSAPLLLRRGGLPQPSFPNFSLFPPSGSRLDDESRLNPVLDNNSFVKVRPNLMSFRFALPKSREVSKGAMVRPVSLLLTTFVIARPSCRYYPVFVFQRSDRGRSFWPDAGFFPVRFFLFAPGGQTTIDRG